MRMKKIQKNWDENGQIHVEEKKTTHEDEKVKKSSQVDPAKIKDEKDINVKNSTEIDSPIIKEDKIWPSEFDNNTIRKDTEKTIFQENKKENNENKVCMLPNMIEEKVIVVIIKNKPHKIGKDGAKQRLDIQWNLNQLAINLK